MGKPLPDSELTSSAQNQLLALKAKFGTWRGVSCALGGFNIGYLSRVANGKRPASKNLRKALGIKPAPRRKYDLTTKEARAVAVRILGILWQ